MYTRASSILDNVIFFRLKNFPPDGGISPYVEIDEVKGKNILLFGHTKRNGLIKEKN